MMSRFIAFDGSGDGGGKNATVFCSRCNAENEIQVDDVLYSSSYKLIVCKSCEEEIVLEDDCGDPGKSSAVTSESISDGGASGQQPACEPTEGGQENGFVGPVGKRQKSRNRKLKSSASYSDFRCDGNGAKTIQQSPSLDTIARNGSEITDATLKQLSEIIQEHPCPHCGCTNRDLLIRVEGINDLIYCHNCNRPYGIDDGMNFFDYQEFLNTGYCMDPCLVCGNDDPEKFTLERSNTVQTDSDSADLVVRCSVCETVSPRGLAQVVAEKQEDVDAIEVSCITECSLCRNKDPLKFEVQVDACNNTIETICIMCNNRKATEVTNQVCSCDGASIDYGFDEYGYINKIKCEACGAVMNTNDDAQKKTSSDGTSRGRTRILCLDMVKPGDHIAWHQWLGYWHHAIVVEVHYTLINIIHYNGPSAHKGVIVNEWRELDTTKEQVYRIDYHREAGTFDPKVVVERARKRLGEHSYNLMTNNCEHFARWCVTGQHRSVQVQTFCEFIVSRVKVATKGRLAQSLTKMGFDLVKKPHLRTAAAAGDRVMAAGQMLLGSGDKVVKGVGTKTSVASGICSRGLSAGFAVGYEIYSVITDIRRAHLQRADGAIDRNEFLKITIKRSCEGVGSLVGTAVTLAIPVANIYVGLTIGTIIGKVAGGIVGRNAACLIDKAALKH